MTFFQQELTFVQFKKHFLFIIKLNPHIKQAFSPFTYKETGAPRKLNHLPKVLVTDKAVRHLGFQTENPMFSLVVT